MGFELSLLLVVAAANLLLGAIVFVNNPKSKANLSFAFLALGIALWGIFNYLCDHPIKDDYALSWNRLVFAVAFLQGAALLHFSWVFPRETQRFVFIRRLIYPLGIILALLAVFTNTIVNKIAFLDWGTNVEPGSLYFIFAAFMAGAVLGTIGILFIKYRHSQGIERRQILFVFFGFLLSGIIAITTNLIIPLLTGFNESAKIGPYSMIFLAGFTAYAIIRHHLLNIKVVATEILVVFINFILLVQALLSKTWSEGLIRGGFLLLTTYFGYLLIKSVISEIERRKEVEELAEKLTITNTNLLTLQHINNKMVSTLDVKKVSQDIVESLLAELSWEGGFLALINDKKEIIYIEAITQKIGKIVNPLLKKPLHKYTLPVRGSESVIQKSIHRLEIEFTDSLDELVRGAIKSETLRKIQSKLKIETFASAPIVYRGKVIGVLIAGFSKPATKIGVEDKKMISSIADQAAIAIENAKLYEQIEKANVKLKSLDKLKNEFLSIASHQVRTPLSIIKGYISLLRDKKAGDISEQQDHFMKNIQEANDQLINIINDFLNLSRIEQKRMKLEISESDVEKTIEQVLGRLNHEAELKNIKLNFIKEVQDIPKINIDEPKIIEVITNLLDNAIKYSPEKSEIKVTLKKDGDRLKISVTDHGIGIPEDFRDKLFQKFSRAHNAIQHQPNGNGIGLFLVKKIIDAHHGKLSVSSKEGKGTTLTVYLSYKSGLKPGEEVDATELTKKGIIRYEEYENNN